MIGIKISLSSVSGAACSGGLPSIRSAAIAS